MTAIEKKESRIYVQPVEFNKQICAELLYYISNNYFKDKANHIQTVKDKIQKLNEIADSISYPFKGIKTWIKFELSNLEALN